MPTANSLPKKLRTRLAELGHRLHRLHIIHGACRVVLVMIVTAFVAVLFDALFRLPSGLRFIMLVGWLALGFFEIRRFRRGPLSASLDAEGLAAAIEQEYPRLGERLTTAVELAGTNDPANGSPDLVDLVIKDAETRTRKLDLKRAAPATATIAFTVACFVALLALLIPLVTVPKASEHARRFFLPWYTPTSELLYRVKVTSGDPVVKRGEMTTLSAVVESLRPNAILPMSALAVIRTDKGTERFPMTFDELKGEAFLTQGPMEDDIDYQIVCGEAESEWHHITVVDPVRLERSRMIVLPPVYARKANEEPLILDGLTEISALQYSQVTFELNFTRVPSAAWLEWKADREETPAPANRILIPLNGEKTASVTISARTNGEFRLHAEADKLKTSFREQSLRVQIDAPPKFEKVSGISARPRDIRPSDKIPINCTVTDDVAVSKVVMEYRVNEGPIQSLPLELKGLGTPQVTGLCAIDLAGKVKENDQFEYRLVATDNRNLPEMKLAPQSAYYPKDEKWGVLHVTSSAAPLEEQEIKSAREEIERRLKAIIEALRAEEQVAKRLRTESERQARLKQEQSEKLGELQNDVHETSQIIGALADDLGLLPDFARLAESIRDVGVHDVVDADVALLVAQRNEKADSRNKHLSKADVSLLDAIRKLEALGQENNRLAAERLDKYKLEQLADEQWKLAKDAEEKKALDELQAKQKNIAEQLDRLQQDSEPLRNAIENLKAQQLDKLADESQRLEQDIRDLTQAMKDAERNSRDNDLSSLLKKQQELAKRANKLAENTDTAARTAPLSPIHPEELEKVVEALKNGNVNDAIDQQEKASLELERLAKALEQAVTKAKDPREFAKQLSRLQEDLRQKVEAAVKETPLDLLPKDRREAIAKQQEAIRNAAAKLSIPDDALEAEKSRKEAITSSTQATSNLNDNDAPKTLESMLKAREALARIAEQLPTQEKRLSQTRAEIAKLRQEQERIAHLAEQSTQLPNSPDPDAADVQSELAKKVADLTKRQAQAADKLSKLDTPGHEERREKTEGAMRQAKNDLEKGRSQDIGASQQKARRELERLEKALNGQEPVDELADHLAKKQKQLADEMQKNAQPPGAKKSDQLQREQAEMTKGIQALPAAEVSTTREDALELSRQTERASTAQEAANRSAQTAVALQKLADSINGRESQAELADRLAKKQREAADNAEQAAAKSLAEARKKAQQMLDEMKDLRPGENAQKEKQKTLQALQRAQQTSQPEQFAKAQQEAADSLKQLADKLAQRTSADKRAPKKNVAAEPDGLPNRVQAEEAHKLAEEQRDLRNELARANEEIRKNKSVPAANPLQELVKEQEKIAEGAKELARRQSDKPDGKQSLQASEAAQQATGELRNGQIESAKEAGENAAQQFKKLAQSNKENEQGKQAGDLAKRQEDVNKKLEETSRTNGAASAQQSDRQKELQKKLDEFSREVQNLAQQLKDKRGSGESMAKEAAKQSEQANESMKNARSQNEKGEKGMARDSQEKAADALKQAREQLKNTAKELAENSPAARDQKNPAQAGQSIRDARAKMQSAENQLGQGKPANAGQSMRQAADDLKRAAEQVGKSNNDPAQPGRPRDGTSIPSGNDGSAQGQVDLSKLGPLNQKYKGKAWGELSGEIKNQVISDFKARYGEDYARYIKLYFEQLAEKK